MIRPGFVVCALLAAHILITPAVGAQTNGGPVDSNGGSRLAFAAFRNGQWDLYSVGQDGNDLRQLTDDPFQDRDPAYSPDGTQLAFSSRRDRNWDVYIMDLDTGQQTRLTSQMGYDGSPAWSPDGGLIAYESSGVNNQAGTLDVWLWDLSKNSPQNLTSESVHNDFAPSWNPDGSRIIFTSWRTGDKDLYELEIETGELTQLSDAVSSEENARWSPDGQQMAFVHNWLGEREIFLTKPGDQLPSQLTWLGRDDSPAWSPEENRLAFINHRYDGEQLMWINLEDTSLPPTALTEVAWLDSGISWGTVAASFGTPIDDLRDTRPTALYEETTTPSKSGDGEPWDLVLLTDVSLPTPDMNPYLSDQVDDSFVALRQRINTELGYDYLGQMSEAYRPYKFFSEVSAYPSWHKSGRAFDTLFDYRTDQGQMMEIARDDRGGETFWRLYMRCTDQDGSCGRPLTASTWNYSHQARAEIAPEQGGIEKPEVSGYYVDLTSLFQEYGWNRISSWNTEDFSWTWHFKAFEYWHIQKTDGMPWYAAMQEVIAPSKLEESFTYDKMYELGVDPYLIALKGVPLPAAPRLWWSAVQP